MTQVQVGDWLDAMDRDGIWNVAQVLRLPTSETMEVAFDCWGDEYNEELRRDSERVAPFHTHTWAVKCWAKLEAWPWWPALLTVRAPGSAVGSQNLRLEERLLVDFLDNEEFPERCRCWVKKSKVVAFQTDEKTRRRLTRKRTKKMRTEYTAKSLVEKCVAREDFPQFVEGTLPVLFEKAWTRPTEQVRKEMGEDIWAWRFAANRKSHAATHAYTLEVGGKADSDETEASTLVKETGDSQAQVESSTSENGKSHNTNSPKGMKKTKDVATEKKKKTTTQKPRMNTRKRARPEPVDETSDSTDNSRTGQTKSPRGQIPENNPDQQVADKLIQDSKMLTRKYGKTPKALKTPRRSTTNLPLYTPPYVRVLKARNKTQGNQASPGRRARPTTERTKKVCNTDKVLAAVAHQVQPIAQLTSVTDKRSSSSNSKSDDESASHTEILAGMTKTTIEAVEKLHALETALEGKRTELAEKFTRAEVLRSKCAVLPNGTRSSTAIPATEAPDVNQSDKRRSHVTCPTSPTASTLIPAHESPQREEVNQRSSQVACPASPATKAQRSLQESPRCEEVSKSDKRSSQGACPASPAAKAQRSPQESPRDEEVNQSDDRSSLVACATPPATSSPQRSMQESPRRGKVNHSDNHSFQVTSLALPAAKAQRSPQDSPRRAEANQRSSQVACATSPAANSPQRSTQESPRRENKSHARPDTTRAPTLARRLAQAKGGVRGLELVMDDIISNELNQSLSSATTAAELDAIKAELLTFPEVQAAITRIPYPSYGWTARTSAAISPCFWEDTKSRFTQRTSVKGPSERKPSPRSPSQHFGLFRGNAERVQGPSSSVGDRNTFGFSADDNFSMGQWYRDLYPRGFQ